MHWSSTGRVRRMTPSGGFCLSMIVCALAGLAAQQQTNRDAWQKVDEVLAALDVRDGSRIADVGAGDGYFTIRLGRRVGPSGRVFAADVSDRALARLRGNVAREGLANVEPILSRQDDPQLPGDLDAILVVNAYHEFKQPDALLRHFRAALRPGGPLVILEPISERRRGLARDDQTGAHEIDAQHVEAELRAAGFRVARLEDPFTSRPAQPPIDEWLIVAIAR